MRKQDRLAESKYLLQVHYSNRLEVLAERLIPRLAADPDPLCSDPVAVPNRLLGRWFSLQMASATGVAANLSLPLHAELVWSCLRQAAPGMADTNEFEPSRLRWKIFAVLLDWPAKRQPQGLRQQLATLDEVGIFQFAGRMARLFDQYLVYRPDWILDWEAGKQRHWQALLWRRLEFDQAFHWARLVQDLDSVCSSPDALPPAVHFLAMSSFSPSFFQVLAWLGRHTEVHLYQWNPSPEYWSDLISPKQSGRQADLFAPAIAGGDNSLLASFGQQLRDCLEVTLGHLDDPQLHFFEDFSESLLGRLQRSVFEVVEANLVGLEPDGSLRIHGCHTARREVEVCYDHLLTFIAEQPAVRPEEICVVAPNMDDYAPYIRAVFGSAPANRRLEFQLLGAQSADGDAHRVLKTLLRALRYSIDREELLELLRADAFGRRFGLSRSDFAVIGQWFDALGLYAGPAGQGGKFTWQQVGQRLLASLTMTEPRRWREGDWLPVIEVALEDFELAGAVATALAQLADMAEASQQEMRSLTDWLRWFSQQLGGLLDPNAGAPALALLAQLSEGLVEQSPGFDQALNWTTFADILAEQLEATRTPLHYAGQGGVRFCTSAAARLQPAKLIYVLGLGVDQFPRKPQRSSMDRMHHSPRLGDRSSRADDRQLLLEWLMTASQQLVLSYLARDPRDNSPLAPSSLVAELLGYLERCGYPNVESLTTQYPLQPFAAQRADGQAHRTYAAQYGYSAGAEAPVDPREVEPDLPAIDSVLSLSAWSRFFAHPTKYFLRQRLGIGLMETEQLADEPPVGLDNLSAWEIRTVLLEQSDADREALLQWLGQRPDVAEGTLGAVLVRQQLSGFLDNLARFDDEPATQGFDLRLTGEHRLIGELTPPIGGRRELLTASKLRSKQLLLSWIDHVVANCAFGQTKTVLYAMDGTVGWPALGDPRPMLDQLFSCFSRGNERLLMLPPSVCETFANKVHRGELNAARTAARSEFYRRPYRGAGPSVSEDVWNALAARDRDWLDPEFEQWSQTLWLPLIGHKVEADG